MSIQDGVINLIHAAVNIEGPETSVRPVLADFADHHASIAVTVSVAGVSKPWGGASGFASGNVLVEVNAPGNDHDLAASLAETVRLALDGFAGDLPNGANVITCVMDGETSGTDADRNIAGVSQLYNAEWRL